MNILRFINSKDIREHLRKLDYQFNSLETAWLIYECRHITIEEKHKAWEELIGTMPDCSIPERLNTVPQESLHTFLNTYMELEDKYIKQFFEDNHGDTYADNRPYVYQFLYKYKDGSVYEFPTVFSTLLALHETIMEPDEDVIEIHCRKMKIDDLSWEAQSRAIMTPGLDFLEIEPHGLEKEEDDIFYGVFEGLWFDFPTPFEKGDIVWNPHMPDPDRLCGGPLVLTGICLEGISEQYRDKVSRTGDVTDMRYDGWFTAENGGVYAECHWNYMDLEYFDKELAGTSGVLIPLSNYLKGQIDEGLYARAFHQILSEEYVKRCMPGDITEEGLRLAGLKPD